MNIKLENLSWIEIQAAVMMYGQCVINIEENADGVSLTYSCIDEFGNEDVQKFEYPQKNIADFFAQISDIDMNVTYDKENDVYFSENDDDGGSEWVISFGKNEDVKITVEGYSIHDDIITSIIQLIQDNFPFNNVFFGSLGIVEYDSPDDDEDDEDDDSDEL